MAAIIALFLVGATANAQVPVTLSPVARQQFFAADGAPLANGCVFTYNSGTSTPAPTYTDQTGLFQASNPIILDGGGFATIWITTQSYRFVLVSAGGVNCATGIQQWIVDGVQPPPFLAGNNAWTGANTFAGVTTFNGSVNMNAGGSLTGTFSGSPNFSGNPSFTGIAIFANAESFPAGISTDTITGITPTGTMAITSATAGGVSEPITIATGTPAAVIGAGSGNISITTPGALGTTGNIVMTTGSGAVTSGSVTIASGNTTTGVPGAVTITAGNAGSNFTQAPDLPISAGNGFGAKGGNLLLSSGSGSNPSFVVINPQTGGDIKLGVGVFNDSSGFKHIRQVLGGTCPTTTSVGDTCTSGNFTWTTPFIDNNYSLVCTLNTPTFVPAIVNTTKLAAGAGFTITIATLTAAAANAAADCVGVHD